MFARFAQNVAKRTLRQKPQYAFAARPTTIALFSTEPDLVPGFGKGKTSTGIVGLPVDPDAVEKMIIKYQALLDKMSMSDMPATAQYRVDVEAMAKYRIEVAKAHRDDPDMVEELCNCGQVEELVEQADDEMSVLEMYLETRMWELVPDSTDIEVEDNPDPAKDSKELDEEEEEEVIET